MRKAEAWIISFMGRLLTGQLVGLILSRISGQLPNIWDLTLGTRYMQCDLVHNQLSGTCLWADPGWQVHPESLLPERDGYFSVGGVRRRGSISTDTWFQGVFLIPFVVVATKTAIVACIYPLLCPQVFRSSRVSVKYMMEIYLIFPLTKRGRIISSLWRSFSGAQRWCFICDKRYMISSHIINGG